MNGKLIYVGIVSLLGVLCSIQSFLLYFMLASIYFFALWKYKRFSYFQILLLFFTFVLFLLSSQFAAQQNKTNSPPSASFFHLEFVGDPIIDGDQLQIKAQDQQYHETYLLRYKIQSESEKRFLESNDFYGRICKVTGSLDIPKQAKNENAFNYREYLKRNSIFWLLESKTTPLQSCTPKKLDAVSLLKQRRFQGIRWLENQFPPEVAAVASALIYGDKSLMSPELLENYQKAGISHLLAISGLHVALLVGMIFLIGIRLGVTRERMTTLILLSLPVYAVLTGGSPSVVRAVLMIFLVMIAAKWKNKVKLLPIDALSLAFLLFLLINPFVVFDVGFQLSFSVSAAIILSAQTILQQYQSSFTKLIMTTVVAQASAFPFIIFHFFGVSLLSIFFNMLFIPLYSYIFLPGVYLLFLLKIVVGKVPGLFLQTFTEVVRLSNYLAQFIHNFSFADFTPGRPGIFFMVIDSLLILFIFILWEKRKNQGKMLAVLCFTLLFLPFGWSRINPSGEVSLIDVGQGDSILIHLPYDKGNYLIDTGGILPFNQELWQQRSKTFEPGKDIVVPFLKGKGITRIDKLILTHGDMDHIGGAFAVIKELKVKQVVMGDVEERSETEMAVIKEADKRGIDVVLVSSGNQWKTKSSRFVILSPEKFFQGERNRGSIVIDANIGGLNWFFGGDLDQAGEEEIVKYFPDVSIDVLKIGHHGSKTSSSEQFLNHYQPKVAVISVGEKNRFGHPNKEVLEKLTKIPSSIFRTDEKGEISYRFLNGKGTFSTYLP